MSRTLRLSIIAVMLLSSTALGIIAYNNLNPPPPPPPPESPPAPVVVVEPPAPEPSTPEPVVKPREWVCIYTVEEAERVRRTLGVIPCSTSSPKETRLVDSAYTTEAASIEDAKNTVNTVTMPNGTVLTFKHRSKHFLSPRDQTPEESAALKAAYEAYPNADDAARREQYIRHLLKKGAPDLDTVPAGPPPAQPPQVAKAGSATIPASEGGHHYPKVTINGVPIRMVADTGAGQVSLIDSDAQKVGIDCKSQPGKKATFNTANGPREGTIFTLPEVTIEGITLRNVEASCGTGGTTSLLGVSALRRFDVRFTSNGYMILSVPSRSEQASK